MPTDSLFVPLAAAGAPPAAHVDILFNGETRQVPVAASVAAALLAGGVQRFRKAPVSGQARAPYCMMGACFECLLEIDGVPDRQACMTPLKPGMQVRTQDAGWTSSDGDSNPALALAASMEVSHGR